MAGGPSPSSTSPSNLSNSPFLHGSFSSASSSPPKLPYSQNTMTADVFSAAHTSYNLPAPIGERRPLEKNALSLLSTTSEADSSTDFKNLPAVLLRGPPSNSDREAVRNMLVFSNDFVDCDIVPTSKFEEKSTTSAVVRFRTIESAKQAKDLLNGKRNASNDATISVDLVQDSPPAAIGTRRNTVDSSATARQGPPAGGTLIPNASTNGRQSSL